MSQKIVSFLGIVLLAFASAGCQGFGFGSGDSGTDANIGSSVEPETFEVGGCPVSKEQRISTVSYDLGNYCGAASVSMPMLALRSSSPYYMDAVNESSRENLFCLDMQALTRTPLTGRADPFDVDAVIKAVESRCADATESSIEKMRNELSTELIESGVGQLLLGHRSIRQFCAEFGLANGMAPPAWLAGVAEKCGVTAVDLGADEGKTVVSAGGVGTPFVSGDAYRRNEQLLREMSCNKYRLWLNWNSKEALQKILDECAAQGISTDSIFEKTSAIPSTTAGNLTQRDMIKQMHCHNARVRLEQLNGDLSSCR